jgi:hypothetical protein
MTLSGNINKMDATIKESVVHYSLPIGKNHLEMNTLIGKNVKIAFGGEINCIHCGVLTEKSHRGGYCSGCSGTLACADTCRTSPEKCHYDEGTCREPKWGEDNCLKPHMIYLSSTDKQKVGITKHVSESVSSRWIDQGATSALPIIITKNRILSGLVECIFKGEIADKTNWRKMLTDTPNDATLIDRMNELKSIVGDKIKALQDIHGIDAIQWVDCKAIIDIKYPSIDYPEKVKSINLEKTPEYTGKLIAIKGQYLLFADGAVINLRKYAGYNLELGSVDE